MSLLGRGMHLSLNLGFILTIFAELINYKQSTLQYKQAVRRAYSMQL